MTEAWELKKSQPKTSFSRCLSMAWQDYYSALDRLNYEEKAAALDTSGMDPIETMMTKAKLLGEYRDQVQSRFKNKSYSW